jgi:Leucine-rich repeat (LRR) protein
MKQHPNITSLDATNSNLTTLSKAFSILHCFMKHLVLSHNLLTALYNDDFLGFVNLENLSLDNNRLTNVERLTFSGLTKVQHLNLSHNNLQYLDDGVFIPLVNVLELKLENNQLTTINMILFDKTKKLSKLDLQNNQIEEITNIEIYYDIFVEELNLESNKLSDLSFLLNFKHLKSLDLSNNINANLTEQTFEHNQQLMNLRLQNVSLNRIGEELPRIFHHLSNLEQLDIGYNHLESINFQLIPFMLKLRGLNLTGNDLKVFIIGDLAKRCPNLIEIDITGHKLNFSTLETLIQYCHDHHIDLRSHTPNDDHIIYISLFTLGSIALVDMVSTLGLGLWFYYKYR